MYIPKKQQIKILDWFSQLLESALQKKSENNWFITKQIMQTITFFFNYYYCVDDLAYYWFLILSFWSIAMWPIFKYSTSKLILILILLTWIFNLIVGDKKN